MILRDGGNYFCVYNKFKISAFLSSPGLKFETKDKKKVNNLLIFLINVSWNIKGWEEYFVAFNYPTAPLLFFWVYIPGCDIFPTCIYC